ncbi:hypothetical protein [Algoriphagus marincola]|uniref:hypothetical protein n=1 Tax=Algoriphagus marincola TaxID=264027 RepID=UPI000424A9F9|nr:hypothetical protein [Algoriphagus marincola]
MKHYIYSIGFFDSVIVLIVYLIRIVLPLLVMVNYLPNIPQVVWLMLIQHNNSKETTSERLDLGFLSFLNSCGSRSEVLVFAVSPKSNQYYKSSTGYNKLGKWISKAFFIMIAHPFFYYLEKKSNESLASHGIGSITVLEDERNGLPDTDHQINTGSYVEGTIDSTALCFKITTQGKVYDKTLSNFLKNFREKLIKLLNINQLKHSFTFNNNISFC